MKIESIVIVWSWSHYGLVLCTLCDNRNSFVYCGWLSNTISTAVHTLWCYDLFPNEETIYQFPSWIIRGETLLILCSHFYITCVQFTHSVVYLFCFTPLSQILPSMNCNSCLNWNNYFFTGSPLSTATRPWRTTRAWREETCSCLLERMLLTTAIYPYVCAYSE